MAYELLVRNAHTVPADAFRALLSEEPWYEVVGDDEGVLLTNNNTGVYVTLARGKPSDDIVYALNFRRPRFFAIEALLTLQRLSKRFGWRINDPQRGVALAFDAHSVAQTMALWDEGNVLAGALPGGVPIAADVATRAWRWNYERPDREAQLRHRGAAFAIPRIFFTARPGERAHTMALWPGSAGGVVLPEVDDVVVRERPDVPGRVLDRAVLLECAVYYMSMGEHEGVPVIATADPDALQAVVERAKREPFAREIVASDMLLEEE